ncbi:MAG: DUF1538 domain-containing protein [Sphaerochaetaceae bacterium]
MSEIHSKLKEVLASVLPIVAIVLALHFTVTPLEPHMLLAFLVGALLVIVGLTLFLFGIDQGLSPIGEGLGNTLAHSNSMTMVILISLVLGFFISYAEPDLRILAHQVALVTSGQFGDLPMVVVISIGLAVMMTLGMVRIIRGVRIRYLLAFAYGIILLLSLFSSFDFLAIAFDASGATTGAITVPFMLALASGISVFRRKKNTTEADNFGLVGIASSGAIIGVLAAALVLNLTKLNGHLPETAIAQSNVFGMYKEAISSVAGSSALSLLPIVAVFIIFQAFYFKYSTRRVIGISRGVVWTYVGLVIFMVGVTGGFMAVGSELGIRLAQSGSSALILGVSAALGLATVLAEPAVHVLTDQVAIITGGSVKRSLVFLFLSIAVGLAIFLSALRILVPQIELWMYLLPGFGLAVLLAFFVPDLFVGMAFDAGGVASGPMTASFSLAFVQGIAAQVPGSDVVTEGFGMIAIVALTPILALEILGALYQFKTQKQRKKDAGHG